MRFALREDERAELLAAQRSSRGVRQWRRYQAVLLRADGMSLADVAQALGCSQASVCNWTRAWREQGAPGVAEGAHRGAERRLDAAAQRVIEALLDERQPQAHGYAATGWTVPLLRTELAKQGWRTSERTLRRTLHRWGWRWKRPQFVLGRPDPAYAEKKSHRRASGSDGRGGRRGVVWR
jgi:transposase